MKKFLFLLIAGIFAHTVAFAQIMEPVKWKASIQEKNNEKEILFRATIEDGWHLYATDIPSGGPIATSFTFDELVNASLNGDIKPAKRPHEEYSSLFDMKLGWYTSQIEFRQPIKIEKSNNFKITGYITYQACNDVTCLPPTKFEFSFEENKSAATPAPVMTPVSFNKKTPTSLTDQEGWQPVVEEIRAMSTDPISQSNSLWVIFISGFVGGLLALLTPCVWPMIPLTVSFFLKKQQSRRKAISEAVLYGLSIIVIYVGVGLIITLLFGASALNDLATNALFNILFFALLVLFAVSFFGAFDITLPASWSNKLDRKADTATGIIAIFFMAFTLVLVSFSCTGPIIGTLLVEAASWGGTLAPAVGMGGFAIALAIPFALFAMFPSLMKQLPKSGGWLNTVKVVLGFLELALSLKFLSVADLAYGWHILDRETFLVLWIVIFAMLGFYLLGKLNFSHDSPVKHISVPRLFLAIVSLSFSLYMVPGLWGAPLKSISAFAPPLYTQDFNLYDQEVHAIFHDYNRGLAYARKTNKPVLIDFSGYGCVNCRKMEATVWTDPIVKKMLEEKFVLITLIVDDKEKLKKPIVVEENGKSIKLTTVGEKWSFLQRYKFGANAQPYYVIINDKGEPLAPPYGYSESVPQFIRFLHKGLKEFNK
ncbi:MAG TPA: thioredoxin family protein [Candidatus Barnesiella excrementigallinarum]|nr:thioredoxin family protein [Candidatus Barnesiella excrementigallinarum]